MRRLDSGPRGLKETQGLVQSAGIYAADRKIWFVAKGLDWDFGAIAWVLNSDTDFVCDLEQVIQFSGFQFHIYKWA